MTLTLGEEGPPLEASFGLSLQQAREQSKSIWARDLQGIYEHAKERFADVQWVANTSVDSSDDEQAEILADHTGAIPSDAVDAILSAENPRYLDDADAIFGHKAIIYARAPKAFKDRYFPVSATGVLSSQNYGGIPIPERPTATSASTPNLHEQNQGVGRARSTSSFAFLPPTKSWIDDDETNALNQLSTSGRGVSTLSHHGTPEMLKETLEWLYTAKVPAKQDTPALEFIKLGRSEHARDGFGEDDGETQNLGLVSAKGVNGVDMVGAKTFKMCQLRLAQDLTYMWRSKLYTDIRIRISTPSNRRNASNDRLPRGPPSAFKIPSQTLRRPTSFSSAQVVNHSRSSTRNENLEYDMDDIAIKGDEETVFIAHRFILCSRSPYFHQVLLNSGAFQSHPAAARHTDSVDQDYIPEITLPSPPFTPMATYFTLGYLYSGSLSFSNKTFDLPTAFSITKSAMFLEVDPLVAELHAIIRDDLCHGLKYPVFWNGKKISGCACKKCIKRIPKVLRFAQAPDVQATELKRDAMAYLSQGWAECWTKDLASLDEDVQDDLLERISSGISANRLVAMYSKLAIAEVKMDAEKGEWVEVLHEWLDALRTTTRQKLIFEFQDVAADTAFLDLLTDNGMDRALRDVILRDLTETVSKSDFCHHAARVYQVLVDKLLKSTVGPEHLPLLPYESSGRQAIEETKVGVLAVIRRRWLQMRPLASFDGLEDWILEEISSELQVAPRELLQPKTPEKRKPTIEVKPTSAVPKARIPLQNQSQKTDVPTRDCRGTAKTSEIRESVQRRAASGVPVAATHARVPSTLSHRRSQPHDATSFTGSAGSDENRVLASSSTSSTSFRRMPSSVTVNAGSPTPSLVPTRQRTVKVVSNPAETSVQSVHLRVGSGRAAHEAVDPKPSTSARISSVSSPAARGIKSVTRASAPIAPNHTTGAPSKMSVPSRQVLDPTSVTRQAGTTGRVAGAVARITANTSKPLITPTSGLQSNNTLRSTASSASLRARERTMNKSESSPMRSENASLRLAKQASTSTASSPKTLVMSSNKDATHLPVRKATTMLATSRSANIQGHHKGHSPTGNTGITSSIARRPELDSPLRKVQSTRSTPPIEDRIIPKDQDSGSTTLITDVSGKTMSPNFSPPHHPTDGSSGPEPPSKALRPLRLVEKRNSIVNSLDEYTAVINDSRSSACLPIRTSEQSLDMARSGLSSNVPRSVLSSLTGIEMLNSQASFDSSLAEHGMRRSKYGSGLGANSGVESQRLPPKDTNLGSDLRTPSLSDKYHPASAFDPPSRIPSISVVELAEEEDDDCIPCDRSKGITLTIGIPCVISLNPSASNGKTQHNAFGSSRSRLRAICRYIGLVDGMAGEWVGVEVNPASLNRIKDLLDSEDGRVPPAIGPHDGSWNNIRYYRIRKDPPSSLDFPRRSVSRPASPLNEIGIPTLSFRTLAPHQPRNTGKELAGMPIASPTISLQNRHRTSSGGVASPTTLLSMDADMSILHERNPESSWISHVASGVEFVTKCGLWVRPADVVFIPGAND